MSGSFPWRLWFLRGLRLSAAVGLIAAGWHMWTVYVRYRDDVDWSIKAEVTYRCAARLSEDQLKPHMNDFGNINVKNLCLTDNDFFVSPEELEEVRKGTMDFGPYWQPFDWFGTVMAGVLWALATILATVAALTIVSVARWVWGASR